MALITTAVVVKTAQSLVEKEALKAATNFLKEKVIGRWSEYRAERFLSAFLQEIRKEEDIRAASADLNDMLKLIAEKADQTSALFDAYRRVALSASKNIGPMVIGLLTAAIVLEDREASEEEEQIFDAAETLNDRDFVAFCDWIERLNVHEDYRRSLKERTVHAPSLPISVLVRGGSSWPPGVSLDHSSILGLDDTSFDLFQEVGSFAIKLKSAGLITERTQPRGHPRNPDGINYYVMVSPACERLSELCIRAKEADF
ncbi:hypothetical protein PQR46_24845 [Paraburkholderia sediminicola]|uniref:hypothetical protein n=1 Tax=Paraburkholderia sediminicola TaxID=458836 RepID=UPI0038BC4B03